MLCQDDQSPELYRLVILVKPESTEMDKNYIKLLGGTIIPSIEEENNIR